MLSSYSVAAKVCYEGSNKPVSTSETAEVTIALTREEADALLSLLLRAPETENLPAGRIEQLLFRILRKIPTGDVRQKNP